MPDTTLDGAAITEVADLARRAADAQLDRRITVDTDDPDGSVLLVPKRDDEELVTVDVERYLDNPRRARGSANVHDPMSFAALVTRHHGADVATTTLWADDQARTIAAVFNDHFDHETPGWRDHTATLTVRVDPDWAAWTDRNGKLTSQVDFGEFIEDQLHTIVDPEPAVLLEVATTFTAKRNVDVESSTRLSSGDIEFAYRENTTAQAGRSQRIEVPQRFTIRVAPFVGVDPVEIVARLRYRIADGQFGIGYRLVRPDVAEREAFDRIQALVIEQTPTGVELFRGTPPAAVRATG